MPSISGMFLLILLPFHSLQMGFSIMYIIAIIFAIYAAFRTFWHQLIPKTLTKKSRGVIMKKNNPHEERRIEDRLEVTTYLDRLRYVLESGKARIHFQKDRKIDEIRDEKFSNRHTIVTLFPGEDDVVVLKRELGHLRVKDYIETVKDKRYPKRSEMRVFGKRYNDEDVYVKIRVELINVIDAGGDNYIFVMSFHFAEEEFVESDFPYRKKG